MVELGDTKKALKTYLQYFEASSSSGARGKKGNSGQQ
jgi:hypothetical protein